MTPQRIPGAAVPDTVVAFGALTLGSVLLDLVAPANVILSFFFGLSIVANFAAGTLRSYAIHRRSGATGKWFDIYRASFGVAKKVALMLFVPLAGIIDGMMLISDATRAAGELTPTVKTMLVVLTGAQVIGAARSLHFVVGDDAIPGLQVLLRAVDKANVDGPLPHRRITDEIIDAHLPTGDER